MPKRGFCTNRVVNIDGPQGFQHRKHLAVLTPEHSHSIKVAPSSLDRPKPLALIPSLLIDATSLKHLISSSDRPTASERASIIGLIGIVYSAVHKAIQNGVAKHELCLWTDIEYGEGVLFKSIGVELPTLVNIEVHAGQQTAYEAEEIRETIARYRPWAAAFQVAATAQRLNETRDIGETLRQDVFIHETLSSSKVPVVWDLRNSTDHKLDLRLRAENLLQVMATFQDVGLDPAGWILNLPENRAVTAILTGRAHIDDRNDIAICFCPNIDIDSVALDAGENSEPSQIEPSLEQALIDASRMPGNVRIAMGAGTFNRPLSMFAQQQLSDEEASNAIASQIEQAARIILGTQVKA